MGPVRQVGKLAVLAVAVAVRLELVRTALQTQAAVEAVDIQPVQAVLVVAALLLFAIQTCTSLPALQQDHQR